jgi:hypothetical protein
MFVGPGQKVLGVAPVSMSEWLIPFGMATSILVTMKTFQVPEAWQANGVAFDRQVTWG